MSTGHSTRGQVTVRQDTETPLTTLRVPFGTVLYLYARSNDSVSNGTIGQDYVAFRCESEDLVFAVCDGVGQSFMGDLAARILGDGLCDWLWKIERPEDAASFSDEVAEALNALTGKGTQVVQDFKLPAHLPPIVVQALEMQRKYGSESMFVAGRIALGGDGPWVALCWLGDSPVAAIDIDGRLVDLGPKGHTSERWNALTGVKGRVHTWVSSAEKVARVAGYTDGLGVESVPTDADLALMMKSWLADPPEDDASLFDIRLGPSPETVGKQQPDALKKLAAEAVGDLRPPDKPDGDTGETTTKMRPISIESEPRTPVAGVEPIQPSPGSGAAVEAWRALDETPGKKRPSETLVGIQGLGELSAQQQIQMWQQAALLGLTSAALAMLMVERLLTEQKDGESDQS